MLASVSLDVHSPFPLRDPFTARTNHPEEVIFCCYSGEDFAVYQRTIRLERLSKFAQRAYLLSNYAPRGMEQMYGPPQLIAHPFNCHSVA